MKKLHLLSTAATFLLLTAGGAAAQGMQQQTPQRAPATQQNAPAEKMGPPARAGEHNKNGKTSGEQERFNSRHETTGQEPKASETEKNKMNSQGKNSANEEMRNSSERKNRVNTNERKRSGSGASSNSVNSKKSTTGQGAAGGAAKLTSEQRTKIATIFREHREARPARLNIAVRVGARVPSNVRFYRLPTQVVEIYPDWRGYDYILVGDQILIIDPATHEIVAILEA